MQVFFTGILYTLHKLTEILWDMAQLATCERPAPKEGRGEKTLPCILAIIKFAFFVYLVRPTNKMYEKNHRKTLSYVRNAGKN